MRVQRLSRLTFLSRKFGFQMPGMGSTRLQELEWHLHTALFSFWLGIAYVKNAHIYRGIIPFVVLHLTGLMLILAFPQLALWLPRWAGFLY